MARDTEERPDPQEAEERLGRRFGSGYETVTGIGPMIKDHEDRASRVWLLSSVFWFVFVTSWGMIIATELANPEFWAGIDWLIFSRARPVHVQGVVYAWLSMMYFGGIFYVLPRVLGTRALYSEGLGIIAAWVYNLAMALGFWGILDGDTQGREWAEFPWLIDVTILLVFAANIVNIVGTVAIRRVRPLYVAVWWFMAAPVWVWFSIFIENVVWRPGNVWGNPSGCLVTGIHDAMINWWGNHNLFGLWLTPILVGLVYYFVPRITNTPLFSHVLGLISFWGLVFVYAAVGHHHLLQTPTPGWLKTIASVNSIAILIPVTAFFSNIFLTMRGNWERFFTNLPLRFVMTGFVFYILVNIQGAGMALQPFNRIIHFTYFIIGHSHLALLGGFTILGMGVVYYMVPHIWDKPPYSRALGEWQYWLVTVGFLLFFTTLTIAAFIQGQNWLNGVNEVLVLPMLRLWNIVRAIAGGMIYAAAWIQLYIILMTIFTDTRAIVAKRVARDASSGLGEGIIRP